MQVTIERARVELDELLNAAVRGEEVLIETEQGQAVQLVPRADAATPVASKRLPRRAGSLQGQIILAPDFDEPLEDFADYM